MSVLDTEYETFGSHPDYPNYEWSTLGRVYSHKTNKYLKSHMNTTGREAVMISVNGKRSHKNIHRIMAEIFIPNPENLTEVDHKDQNYRNNHISNLRWSTKSDNQINRPPVTKVMGQNVSSKFRGVSKRRDKFLAMVSINRKAKYIGMYATEIEAAKAFDNYVVANKLKPMLNFPSKIQIKLKNNV